MSYDETDIRAMLDRIRTLEAEVERLRDKIDDCADDEGRNAAAIGRTRHGMVITGVVFVVILGVLANRVGELMTRVPFS